MKLIRCLDLKLIHLSVLQGFFFINYTGIKLQNNFPCVVSLPGIGDILTANHLIKQTVCFNSTRYPLHNYSYFEMYMQVIRKQMQPETNFHTHAHMQQSYQICNQLVNNEQIPSPNLSIKSLMRAVEKGTRSNPPQNPPKGEGGQSWVVVH